MGRPEKPFKLTWPKGAKLSMDERSFLEMRKGLEIQFKHMIYKQPGFRFFHSIGNTNFFQRFKTDDGIDFGVLHVYWDRDAENMIDYVDKEGNVTPHSKKGDWRHRWLKHEDGYPVVAPSGNSPISEEGWNKILQIHADKIRESLEKNAGEGFDFGAVFDKWKPKEFWEDAPGKIALIGESIRNIAWENDILLNAVKKYGKEVGKVFIPSEDSEIRKTIASVLEGDESIANAKSAEDIKNIIKDKGLLKSIVSKIMSAFESDAKEEWEGTRFEGMTPGEVEEILNQETEQVGMIDGSPTGTLTQADKSKIDSEMQTAYDVGDETVADLQLPSDPKYLDSPSMHPDRDVVDTPRGETLETPPGTGEPHDVNYVEGRKAGTTNITSMTVGEIAEQYGYGTRVGMMALSYNEIIDLMKKHFYTNMSKKEVRERVDSLPFGSDLQKRLLYLSLGRD